MLRVGTSGFSYESWRGSFYPEELPTKRWLAYYAERLPAVEINNTFYRMPKASVLAGWAEQVSDDFRFAIKAPRRITHIKRLASVEEETSYLIDVLGALGSRLGAVLFQLPPNLKLDLARLERFIDLLAGRLPVAFEFRHPTWSDPAVVALLRARGAAVCIADVDGAPAPEALATAPFAYARLRRECYAAGDLAEWVARLRALPARDAFVFFKHDDAGVGPRLAAELLSLAGARAVSPQELRERRTRDDIANSA
ncbi:MAG TPA: DUF72 domain-containing protein [Myxococcota bacterium]|nr:DUF72 domain-containing protein [Myxococcota bacterium]